MLGSSGPTLCEARWEGRHRACDPVMKYDGFHCLFLISSLSGARIYLTTRDQVTQNKCVPCFYIVLRANYRSRAVQWAWAVWAVCRSERGEDSDGGRLLCSRAVVSHSVLRTLLSESWTSPLSLATSTTSGLHSFLPRFNLHDHLNCSHPSLLFYFDTLS